MDNRLKEMIDYISAIEKKSSDLIKRFQKNNLDLNKILELTNKLEKSESSIKNAKKNIDNLISKIKTGKF